MGVHDLRILAATCRQEALITSFIGSMRSVYGFLDLVIRSDRLDAPDFQIGRTPQLFFHQAREQCHPAQSRSPTTYPAYFGRMEKGSINLHIPPGHTFPRVEWIAPCWRVREGANTVAPRRSSLGRKSKSALRCAEWNWLLAQGSSTQAR